MEDADRAPLPDPRVNAWRPEIADIRLKGQVKAERFATGHLMQIVAGAAALRSHATPDAPYETELLHGEEFRVFDDTVDGWSWGQNRSDRYVGFVRTADLGPIGAAPTHRVSALRTFVYPGPDMKLPPVMAISLGSRLALGDRVETRGTPYRLIAGTSHAVGEMHVAPIEAPPAADFVDTAVRFLGVPYLWGGRTSLGLDCSALVQISLMSAGIDAPRDTDMQFRELGAAVDGGVDGDLRRGDLVFWPGHVAILTARDAMIHASGWHLEVVREPLSEALNRIAAARPIGVKRLPGVLP